MEMKAMMFAGGGLFLSMVATTIWISGDVTRMRAEERAKDAQECALAQQADAPQSQSMTTTPPASDFATSAAPQADDSCAVDGGVDPNAGAFDPTTGAVEPAAGAVDPVTGAPLQATSSDQFTDPTTGLPAGSATTNVDPNTGLPISSDPSLSTGTDPNVIPETTQPTAGNVAEAGF